MNVPVALDGATAFGSIEPDAGNYANALGRHTVTELHSDDRMNLTEVVSNAISDVAHRYELHPSHSPSSTVTIVHIRDQHVDLFILGDAPLYDTQYRRRILDRRNRPRHTPRDNATLAVHDLSWAVLATDGITNSLTHLGRAGWAAIATISFI
ncbi:MAG: hypothetical protein ACRDRU_09805 [Pseudonocardiaceae bacterium]